MTFFYMLVHEIGSNARGIRDSEDQEFWFPADDGPMLADMLDSEWPECERCEDRACLRCDRCHEAGCACECPDECEECDLPAGHEVDVVAECAEAGV